MVVVESRCRLVMKPIKPTATKPRERKHQDGVANKLANRRTKPAPEPLRDVTKPMLSKLRRAFNKAGVSVTDDELEAFAKDLIQAEVPFMRSSSGRIARVITNEIGLGELRIEYRKKSPRL